MRRTSIILIVAMAFGALLAAQAQAQEESKAQEEAKAEHMYIGATKCKMCHNSAKKGEIYDKWLETSHAKAFEVLASEDALKIAAEKDIEDPQKADDCLKCHVTGHGAAAELLDKKYDATEGVTCESCHGPGGDYWKNKVMKAITAGEQDGAEVGLVMPDEKTCVGCHNEESPTFTEFKFDEMYAKIEHRVPAAEE